MIASVEMENRINAHPALQHSPDLLQNKKEYEKAGVNIVLCFQRIAFHPFVDADATLSVISKVDNVILSSVNET